MDHDNLRKSYTGKLPDRILKLDEKQNHQKAAEWDEKPRTRPTIQWKVSPMMKNQTAKIKKVKS